jgi:diadenosine hexaphosphate hydrolase (ATP-forming)
VPEEETAAGAIVFRGEEVLLVRDRYGRLTFPKGHVEPGEGLEATALRELAEETGVVGVLVGPPLVVRYAVPPRGTPKSVAFFPARWVAGEPRPQAGEAGRRGRAGVRRAPAAGRGRRVMRGRPAGGRRAARKARVVREKKMVGWTGFEPATSASRTQRATKLRHHPMRRSF